MGQPTEELLSMYLYNSSSDYYLWLQILTYNASLMVISQATTSTGSTLTEIPGNISEKLYYSFLHSQFQGYLCYLLISVLTLNDNFPIRRPSVDLSDFQ